MSLRSRAFLASALVASLAGSASATVIIDNFTQGGTNLALGGSTGAVESQQSAINVPGTQRDVMLTVTSNTFGLNSTFDIIPVQGMGYYSSGPGVLGGVSLDYDGVDTENLLDGIQTAGPGLNLNLLAENAFRFVFTFADLGATIQIDAFTYGGGSSRGTGTVAANITSPTNIDINVSSFSVLSGPGVNWSDVDRLVITFGGPTAKDFALSSITAVPEPASMAALAVGALGLIARRRARK